jgi:hypothetical protein
MLEKVWFIASEFYHTDNEAQYFIDLILSQIKTTSVSIVDVSCGTGFPIIKMLQSGFSDIHCSDGYKPNVKLLNQELIKLGYAEIAVPAKFQELWNAHKRKYDVVFSIGTSITYCESWDMENIGINNASTEIRKSIRGMTSILNSDGILIIGIANLYDMSKKQDIINFPEKKFEVLSII